MDLGYTPLGQISYSVLPGSQEGFELLQSYQKKIGMNAFKFIPFDKQYINDRINDIKISCPDWSYISARKETQKPEYALVIRNMLENKPFEEVIFTIQKEKIRIDIYCVRGFDEYMFVSFYPVEKVLSNKKGDWHWETYDGDLRLWEAFICDIGGYDDSFQNLLKMVTSKI